MGALGPAPLRYRLAYDHRLCRTVLHVFVRALRSAHRREARRQGLSGGETGMVTSVQRFGGAVNVHLHFHTLVLDGVFVQEPDGTLRFHPASPSTDDDVHRVVARVRRRLERLGVTRAASADKDADPLADESAALAGLSRAAILGRAALGPRAARRPVRIGADPDAPWVERHVPLHAHEGGFDLHASVHVAPGDRERLERLCQYLCRPPLGQSRLHRLRDGRSPSPCSARGRKGRPISSSRRWNCWSGSSRWCPGRGSTWSSITASWRRTRRGARRWWRAPSPRPARSSRARHRRPPTTSVRMRRVATRPKYRAWADLMRRAFEADVLACPKCGGRMIVLATIEDAAVIRRILTHLGLSMEAGEALPAARASPWTGSPSE